MIPNHKGEIPVVILLLHFLLGIIAGVNFFAGVGANWLIVAFIFLSLVFVILNINFSRLLLYKQRWPGGLLMAIILFLFGWIIVSKHSELLANDHFSKITGQYLVVKINKEPVLKNGYYRFIADVEESINKDKKSNTSGTLLIAIKDSAAKSLYYGDELLIPAKYSVVDPPFNPAEFNYKKYLANKNIFYQAFLYPNQFKVLKTNTGNPLIAYALRLRQQLVYKLKTDMRDTGAFSVASTLILGYKADLSNDILESYSKTGTVYVLSVSGAQVAIIYLLLAYALSFLDRFKYGKLIKAVLIISVLWYYAMLTGFSLAVIRVSLMVSMVIIGKSFTRYINTLNILAVSAFVLLCYNPYFITEVGFQLSYIAVSGLMLFQPVVYRLLKFKNRWADKLWVVCSVSIAAQVITFPLSAFYFHQFPVYFLASNLFVVVPAAIIMYAGIFYLLLPQVPVISTSLAFILEKTIILMNKGLAFIEQMPFATVNKLWPTRFEYLLMYAIIISLFYFLYDKKTMPLKLSLFCSLLLCFSLTLKRIDQSRSKNIAWLNLKKHTGIIFKNGNEAVVLSDLKNTDKAYLYSIQPYLDSCQVKNVYLYNLNQDIDIQWLRKKYGMAQFLNTGIFIFNGQFKNNPLTPKLAANYIYVTGNPVDAMNKINSNFEYNSIIIEGSNSDRNIAEWQKLTAIKHINCKILKRNNSIITLSN
jgi:competence protein ComEC